MFNSMKQAMNPYTNYVTLRELATSRRPALRAAVAGNRNLQPFMMERMASDKIERVRVSLATNPRLTAKVWDMLVEDESEAVRKALKEHHPERIA